MQPETPVNERRRTYTYADGHSIRFSFVDTVRVSESGTHYLKCHWDLHGKPSDQIRLIIVKPGWEYIDIDPGERAGWTF